MREPREAEKVQVTGGTRRELLLGTLGMLAAEPARAGEVAVQDEIQKLDNGKSLQIRRFVSPGEGLRPTVLILHGSKGLAFRRAAYERYGHDLATAGMDAWLFSYFEPGVQAALAEAVGAPAREAIYARSIGGWVDFVRVLGRLAEAAPRSAGPVGLLGFSLGGFLAVAAANRPLFSAVCVFYAGLPRYYSQPITALPPLLDLHGDADRSVPLRQGEQLVDVARRLGGIAELAVFPGEGHGFDLDGGSKTATAATDRAVAFLRTYLQQR